MLDHLNSDRRRFLKLTSSATLATMFTTVGGAFSKVLAKDPSDFYREVIPSVKDLDQAWVRSLYQKAKYQKGGDSGIDVSGNKKDDSLKYIGMTVGGVACGSVYLGGDGRLWVWDIFNQKHEGIVPNRAKVPAGMENIMDEGSRGKLMRERDGSNFVKPPTPDTHPNPFQQGFGVQLDGESAKHLDSKHWENVNFLGEWPIGTVRYDDANCPVKAQLQAYSPFIPLNLDDSSLPVTVVEIEITNTSKKLAKGQVVGWLENILSKFSGKAYHAQNSVTLRNTATVLHLSSVKASQAKTQKVKRDDILFEDFEGQSYGKWNVEGDAFGKAPVKLKDVPSYQGKLNGKGKRVANSHSRAPGNNARSRDQAVGKLTSPEFAIERDFIYLLIGGGKNAGKTCVHLLIDGKVVQSLTGDNANAMRRKAFDVTKLNVRGSEKKPVMAVLQIVDAERGGWGNIGVDHILFSDQPAQSQSFEKSPQYGDMTLCLLDEEAEVIKRGFSTKDFSTGHDDGARPCGSLSRSFSLQPGESVKVTYLLTWHFANLGKLPGMGECRRHYITKYKNAPEVADYVIKNFKRLSADTKLWTKTWYDGTMPKWLMDRTMLTTNTIQTQNCFILEDGRFWAWEGIGCCPGTCMHVWHYAQGIARVFPEIERRLREITDYGVSYHEKDGMISYRGEAAKHESIDGQASLLLRTLREHQNSPDDAFLKRLWPRVKKALEYLIHFDQSDGDFDGVLHGRQYNTLDAAWYGKVPCLSSLYIAALRAGEEMATAMGDSDFQKVCRDIHSKGRQSIEQLYDGEYYIQEEDPKHPNAIGVSKGCYIDQVIGQFWAFQTGLGRIYKKEHVQSALHSLWKYNFLTDVGPFRKVFTRGRFYALNGDAGLLMCTWPKGGMREDFKKHWQYVYFNECMTGFEHQVAAHMISEGLPVSSDQDAGFIENPKDGRSLTLRGLTIIRAVHDRYAAKKRNPYNEIECSDHYARANASYGTLIAACGFTYNGPQGQMGFDPKLQPENFKSPFIASEGWGSYAQKIEKKHLHAQITLVHGRLKLNELTLTLPVRAKAKAVTVNGKEFEFELLENRVKMKDLTMVATAGKEIQVEIEF